MISIDVSVDINNSLLDKFYSILILKQILFIQNYKTSYTIFIKKYKTPLNQSFTPIFIFLSSIQAIVSITSPLTEMKILQGLLPSKVSETYLETTSLINYSLRSSDIIVNCHSK